MITNALGEFQNQGLFSEVPWSHEKSHSVVRICGQRRLQESLGSLNNDEIDAVANDAKERYLAYIFLRCKGRNNI